MSVFILFSTICLLIILYLHLLNRKSHKRHGQPLNSIIPSINLVSVHLWFLDAPIYMYRLGKDGMGYVERLVEKYGKTFRYNLGTSEYLATSDPMIIKKLLSSKLDSHLEKPQLIYVTMLGNYLKDGLFASRTNVWSPHRSAISRAFTYKSLPRYLKFMNDAAQNVVKSAFSAADQNSVNYISNKVFKSVIDREAMPITTKIILGSETLSFTKDEQTKYCEHTLGHIKTAASRYQNPLLMIPVVWFFNPSKRLLDHHDQQLYELSGRIINKYRTATQAANTSKSDETYKEIGIKPFECLVEQMIKAGFSNDEILVEISTFLLAGHETLTVSLDTLIFHLASNINCQDKCRLEVDDLFDKKLSSTNSHLTLENCAELKYLEQCILESLRITPSVPAYARRLDADLEIDKGQYLESGCNVIVMLWPLHRNPDIYPNPKTFDPDRFLPENMKTRDTHVFIPFSKGMRNCIGSKVGLLEMKVMMAWILRHFTWTTPDTLDDYEFTYDLTIHPKTPFNVTFKKRLPENTKM